MDAVTPVRLATVAGNGTQRAGAGEQLDERLGRWVGAVGKLVGLGKRPEDRAVFGAGAALVCDQTRDHPQTQPDLGLAGGVWLPGCNPRRCF
jgi:hypothetical protein